MKIFMLLLRNKKLLGGLGFILLVLIILRGGAILKLSMNTRILIIIVLLFVGILYLQIRAIQARRGAAMLEQSIQAQADQQKLGMRPEKREEIDSLKSELTAAIESLKKTKLGRGRSGTSALYALPWYMFIGPPAAGKTTAIINSGLEFPYGSDIKGVGGTRNCDWFFSNSAILLDTAGRYTTEEDDREEWQAFLDILKKYRKRRPINGVLVGVAITDLIGASAEDIEWHAKNIRRRIEELVQKLGVRFPVYLVFTKCDLLQGFVELYENMSRKEREQIWGSTFSREQRAQDPRELFNREFEVLLRALYDFRLKRLSGPTKSDLRSQLYIFPMEFASVKDNLGHFISLLFQPNPYQENPFFRGFYFTSGTQEGVPIDLVIQSLARQFDLPAGMLSEPEIEKKSYFIKKLFTDVIIPDQNMSMQTSGAAVRRNLVRIGTVAISALALGLFIIGVMQGFIRSRVELSGVKNSAALMERVRWDSSAALVSNFTYLDRLREQLARLMEHEDGPPVARLGMYRGNTVLPPARELYYDRFRFFAERVLYRGLLQKLMDYGTGASYPPGKVKDYLRAYLLISSEIARLEEDPSYREFLKQHFLVILDEAYAPPAVPEDKYVELRPLMERQVEFYVQNLGKEGIPGYESDSRLIRQVRNAILMHERDSVESVYAELKYDPRAAQYSYITLSNAVGDRRDDLVTSSARVAGIFTKEGYEEFFEKAVYERLNRMGREDWVMGEVGPQTGAEQQNTEELAREIKRLYFREYAEQWWEFLRAVEFKPYDNLMKATNALKTFGDSDESPMVKLVEMVSVQTQFVPLAGEAGGILDKSREKIGDFLETGEGTSAYDRQLMRELTLAFQDIHDLSPRPGEGASEALAGILGQYISVSSLLESMLDDPETKAKDFAAKVLSDGTGELPLAVTTIRLNLSKLDSPARRAMFEQPLIQVWQALLDEAQKELNSLWADKVYEEYQNKLGDYYPFNREGRDATIADVEAFFKPEGGILWGFIDEDLAPFVNRDDWTAMTCEDRGIRLSPQTLEALQKAESIRKDLFEQGGFPINFRMQPDGYTSVSGSVPFVIKIELSVDGVQQSYEMGHKSFQEFFWPRQEGSPGARLQILMREKRAEPPAKEFLGAWGFYRLLEEAEIELEASSSTMYKISWQFSHSQYKLNVVYRLQARSVANPFKNLGEFFRFHCPSRLD